MSALQNYVPLWCHNLLGHPFGDLASFSQRRCVVARHRFHFADCLSISSTCANLWSAVNRWPIPRYLIALEQNTLPHQDLRECAHRGGQRPWRLRKAAELKQVAVPQPVNGVSLKTAWALITNHLDKKNILAEKWWKVLMRSLSLGTHQRQPAIFFQKPLTLRDSVVCWRSHFLHKLLSFSVLKDVVWKHRIV